MTLHRHKGEKITFLDSPVSKLFIDLWTVMLLSIREKTDLQCMSLCYMPDLIFSLFLVLVLPLSLTAGICMVVRSDG